MLDAYGPYIVLAAIALARIFEALILKSASAKHARKEAVLREEIRALRSEATKLSTPSTFAQSAKLQRQAIKKEKELEELEASRQGTPSAVRAVAKKAPGHVKLMLMLVALFRSGRSPVLFMSNDLMWPMSRMLSAMTRTPLEGMGVVGGIAWILTVDRACVAVCDRLTS